MDYWDVLDFKVVDDKILVHYVVEGNKDIGISIESGSQFIGRIK